MEDLLGVVGRVEVGKIIMEGSHSGLVLVVGNDVWGNSPGVRISYLPQKSESHRIGKKWRRKCRMWRAGRNSPLKPPFRPARSLSYFFGDFGNECKRKTWSEGENAVADQMGTHLLSSQTEITGLKAAHFRFYGCSWHALRTYQNGSRASHRCSSQPWGASAIQICAGREETPVREAKVDRFPMRV